jgi:hypothetical protein
MLFSLALEFRQELNFFSRGTLKYHQATHLDCNDFVAHMTLPSTECMYISSTAVEASLCDIGVFSSSMVAFWIVIVPAAELKL